MDFDEEYHALNKILILAAQDIPCSLLYFHRTQMPWQRANHDALLLIVMQEVDPEQILRIISHSQVIIQGTLNRLPISAWKVFDLVLAWRILNRCDTSWFYLKGTTILL